MELEELFEAVKGMTIFWLILSLGAAGLMILFAKPDSEIRDDDDY